MLKSRKSIVSLVAMCLMLPAAVRAEDKLPTGKELMEKYITATGGRAAYEKVKSRIMTASFEIAAANVKGEVTTYQSADGKIKEVANLGSLGTQEEVFDGTVGWSSSAMAGVALKDEADLEDLKLRSLNSELKYEESYKSLEVTGVEEVNSKPAYILKATSKAGKETTMYFDKETNLPVKLSTIAKTPQGEIPVSMQMSEYKEFDGVKMATVVKNEVMGQTFVITITDVKQNTDIPAGTFDQPEDVKKLIAKKSAAPATQPSAK